MRNNYFSGVNAAKSLMDIWLAEDASSPKPKVQRQRHLIFINSAAAFLGLPGSIAYTSELRGPILYKAVLTFVCFQPPKPLSAL